MDPKHYNSLEQLSLYCFFCGLLPTFLGVLMVFMDVVTQAYEHMLIGIFIFITGYSQVKISERLDSILNAERKRETFLRQMEEA